ncbi:hypothetical protein KCV01_g24472, partial [Aureobasidium melanogenum]
SNQSLKDVVKDLHIEGFDVGLEMSGNPRAFNDMLECMYHGGKIAMLGIMPRGAGIDWDKVIFKGLTLQGIYGRKMYETWYKMTQMVLTGFPLQKVLTHQISIDDFQKGFDLMDAGHCGKVVCSWTKRNIHWQKGRDTALNVYRSRRARRIALGIVVALVLFGLLGFFAAPPIIRSQLASRASTALDRPVAVERVSLNPFTLKLTIEGLHVSEKDGKTPFVDVGKLTANASWASLFRLAPILDSLTLDRPYVHLQRSAPQRFNFSDIVERFASPPDAKPSDPSRFALSNIAVHGGRVDFDDRVSNATHRLDAIELGIPFIANLPSDADIYVQPL